jgi:diacylglycerol diphosphate phosphatase/phosphatidate phosphatase
VREDTDLAHPHLENIVSNVMLWIYAVVVPVCVGFVFFAVSWILGRLNSYDASFSLHLYIISLFLAIAITGLVTNIFKIWGGRFRPDFLDRCKYDELAGKCTGDEKLGWFWLIILVLDGRKSWPSGHSSLCFAGLGFLGMWFFGLVLDGTYIASDQMNVFRRGYLQNRPGRAWRFILPFAPWLWAAYVAISRTQQYVHHPTDVLSGIYIL